MSLFRMLFLLLLWILVTLVDARHDMCLVRHPSCDHFTLTRTSTSTGFPFSELSRAAVHGNVPISCAEYIVIGERHHSKTHNNFQKQLILYLTQPHDIILLESHPSLLSCNCSKPNQLDHDKHGYQLIASPKQGLNCIGWDHDISTVTSLEQGLIKLGTRYNTLIWNIIKQDIKGFIRSLKNWVQLFNTKIKSMMPSLESHQVADFGLIGEDEMQKVARQYPQISAQNLHLSEPPSWGTRLVYLFAQFGHIDLLLMENYYKLFTRRIVDELYHEVEQLAEVPFYDPHHLHKLITLRNQEMIRTLQITSCTKPSSNQTSTPCVRKIVITGAAHVFEVKNKPNSLDWTVQDVYVAVEQARSDPLTGQLLSFLQQHTYAIVYPFDRTSS